MTEWTQEQLANAAAIQVVGKRLGASTRDIQTAIMAAIVESGLRNLNYGDRDSIGMFQQRDAWGSAAARLDPYKSAEMFFLGGAAGQRGLLDLTNRDSLAMGEAAQAVQVSAYPDRYGQQESAARSIMGSLGGVAPTPAGPSGTTLGSVPGIAESTQAAIGTPVEPTTTEVDGLGEITADESGIGALTFDNIGGPLDALEFGQAATGQPQDASPASTPSGVSGTPSSGSPTPAGTVTEQYVNDLLIESAPSGTGEVFTGSFAGKDPYALTTFNGETVDYMTAAALEAAKAEFGGDFSIMQGSHSDGSVAASGSTHDGGGVVDLSVPSGDWEGAVTALRKIGFAAWIRNVDGYGQAGSGAHIHAILMGNEQLSPQAQIQVQSYLNNDDGLQGSRADDGPRDYVNNRFSWEEASKEPRPANNAAVRRAMKLVGLPHKWGGKDYEGLDGEGLARMVYEQEGLKFPRHLTDMIAATEPIPEKDMVEGDMIVWDSHPEWGTPHLGIYMGSGLFAEVRPGGQVQMTELSSAPRGYMSIVPPKAVETGPGLNQPVRNMAAPQPPAPPKPVRPVSIDTPDRTIQPPKPTPAPAPPKPTPTVAPPKPTKSSNVAPGGRLADGFV